MNKIVANYPVSADVLQNKLLFALKDRYCSKIWLGYAEVIFAGFDPELILYSERQYRPPFEIHTHYADWLLEKNGVVVVSNSDNRERILIETKDILLKKVSNWNYSEENFELRIEIEETWVLVIKPWVATAVKSNHPPSDAWALRFQSEGYYSVDCKGNRSFQPSASG
ncbi:MAG: hypothetical protein H7308_08040 [Chthonomonadaceae bacterium]|nr:hypothetical protein [Chthonomonadaceae bacterium]